MEILYRPLFARPAMAAPVPARTCIRCAAVLPAGCRADRRYCSRACREAAKIARRLADPARAGLERERQRQASARRYARPAGRSMQIAATRAWQEKQKAADPEGWRERNRERHARYRATPKGRAACRAASRRYIERQKATDPEGWRARCRAAQKRHAARVAADGDGDAGGDDGAGGDT